MQRQQSSTVEAQAIQSSSDRLDRAPPPSPPWSISPLDFSRYQTNYFKNIEKQVDAARRHWDENKDSARPIPQPEKKAKKVPQPKKK